MRCWVARLYALVVSSGDHVAARIEQRTSDRNAAFAPTFLGHLDGGIKAARYP
jgi:hypothetical protein